MLCRVSLPRNLRKREFIAEKRPSLWLFRRLNRKRRGESSFCYSCTARSLRQLAKCGGAMEDQAANQIKIWNFGSYRNHRWHSRDFLQKPSIDGETFFSRKGVYCINLQLICDDNGMIRHCLTGWPGSAFDNSLFEKMLPCRKLGDFFTPGEFLLADSGYSLKIATNRRPRPQPAT